MVFENSVLSQMLVSNVKLLHVSVKSNNHQADIQYMDMTCSVCATEHVTSMY